MFDVVAYFVLSPNGEEYLNKFLTPDPDPDHLRGPSHGYETSCVEKIKTIGKIVFELCVRADIQTDPNA